LEPFGNGYRNCVAGGSLAEVSGILPTPLQWFSRYSRSVLHRRLRPNLRKPAALRIPDRGGCHALSPALGRSTHYCRLSAGRLGGVPGAARRHPEPAHHRDLDPDSGNFCPSQKTAGAFGVSGSQCITETGSPAGDLSTGAAKPAILASAFCIPTTTNSTIDLVDVVALVDAHLLDLGGTYGHPEAGDPLQYDELRIEHDQGDVEIVVYNRAILLFRTDSEAMRRIHQVCCRLDDLAAPHRRA
jgi:hypothetical protein